LASAAPAPSAVRPWPPALVGSPTITVIERALASGRLGHSLLLHGESLETLSAVAAALSDRLLNPAGAFAGANHPDCFELRPTGKMRIINVDLTRELIDQVQVTAGFGDRKVAIIHEVDRMNLAAANSFLKTLEEPPGDTTLLLLTVHPHALLPTIRSRCLHFRIPADPSFGLSEAEGWAAWLDDYRAWLGRVAGGRGDPRLAADHVFSVYGLLARFSAILEKATAVAWTKLEAGLPPDLEDEKKVAIETGLTKGLRSRFFAEIEGATRTYARTRLAAGDDTARGPFAAAVEEMERVAGLLQVNLNELVALESFLLASLRLWSKKN
jgi:DNA polymerase-3 subunit delta'